MMAGQVSLFAARLPGGPPAGAREEPFRDGTSTPFPHFEPGFLPYVAGLSSLQELPRIRYDNSDLAGPSGKRPTRDASRVTNLEPRSTRVPGS